MANRTLQKRVVAALIARGYGAHICEDKQFITLVAIGENPEQFYYVNLYGNINKGTDYYTSKPVPRLFKENLLRSFI